MRNKKLQELRDKINGFLLPLCFYLALLALLLYKFGDRMMLPPMLQLVRVFFQMCSSGEVSENVLMTLKRFCFGFSLGAGAGLAIGFLCGISKKTRYMLEPLVYFLYPLPRFVLFPFLILIFGSGMGSHVVFVAMGAFFPCVINTLSGFEQINNSLLEVAHHYGAKGWPLFRRVIFPASLPSLFAGLRVALGLALTYTVIVEYLVATKGLGALIWLSLQTFRIDKLVIGGFLVAALNLFFILIVKVSERVVIPWESA